MACDGCKGSQDTQTGSYLSPCDGAFHPFEATLQSLDGTCETGISGTPCTSGDPCLFQYTVKVDVPCEDCIVQGVHLSDNGFGFEFFDLEKVNTPMWDNCTFVGRVTNIVVPCGSEVSGGIFVSGEAIWLITGECTPCSGTGAF